MLFSNLTIYYSFDIDWIFTFLFKPLITSSASLSMFFSSTSQVGISFMRPNAIPALQIPYYKSMSSVFKKRRVVGGRLTSGSPFSYTTLPLAPDTNSRRSSNLAPPGRRSSATTSIETLFLKTRAVLWRVRKI